MTRVRPGAMMRGLIASVRNPVQSVALISAKSSFMKDRFDGASQEMMSTLDTLLTDKGLVGKLREKGEKHGYFAQVAMQNLVDKAVWLGAYDQASRKGMSEADAVYEADSVVRTTQGSFAPEDLSNFEAKTALIRLFTKFYSYFNAQFNLARSEMDIAVQESGWAGATPRLFTVYMMVGCLPAVLADAIVQGARGELGGDDEDDSLLESLAEMFLLSNLRYVGAMIPGVGQAVNFAMALSNNKPYDDRLSVSPVASQLERAGVSAYKIVTGQEVTAGRAIADGLNTLGLLTGLPLGQAGKYLGKLVDWE
jgi:hypothetical protein